MARGKRDFTADASEQLCGWDVLWARSHKGGGWQPCPELAAFLRARVGVCVGLGAMRMGEVQQGPTLHVENVRKGKLEIQGIHSPVVFLQLVGKFGVSMARKARASPGHCSGSTVSKLRCCNQSFL